ncbi:hypothetical protein BJF90_31825 [Pseudonocardia sp. CNS-004]|nr:hypothetical protein BJF90_31825 [Pseudonocardia sp. CNS-004]
MLVGEPQEDSVLHGPPIDRVSGTTSHRSSGMRPANGRRIRRSDSLSWRWTVRWYRARWAARRALRSR